MRGGDRQIDAEGCAFAGAGSAFDTALALGNDAVDRGESEAGGEWGVLGGEERLEDVVQRVLIHANAGIGDGEHGARLGERALERIGISRLAAGGDSQHAAPGHGFSGVVGQVHQHQRKLLGVDEDVIGGFIQLQFNGDIDPGGAGDDGERLAYAVVHVHHAGLQNLAAAEGEKRAGDLGGPRGLAHDVEQFGFERRSDRALQRQFAGEADGLGDVVEVVSYTAGKTPHGFHAMRVAELLFEFALAGDVNHVALNVLAPGLGVGAEIAGKRDANDRAIPGAKMGLKIAHTAGLMQPGEVAVAVTGVRVKFRDRRAGKLLKRIAKHAQEHGVGLLDTRGGEVDAEDSEGTLLNHRAVDVLGADEFELRFAPGRSVNGRQDDELAARVPAADGTQLNSKGLARARGVSHKRARRNLTVE